MLQPAPGLSLEAATAPAAGPLRPRRAVSRRLARSDASHGPSLASASSGYGLSTDYWTQQ